MAAVLTSSFLLVKITDFFGLLIVVIKLTNLYCLQVKGFEEIIGFSPSHLGCFFDSNFVDQIFNHSKIFASDEKNRVLFHARFVVDDRVNRLTT
jgi:hypothetical protein